MVSQTGKNKSAYKDIIDEMFKLQHCERYYKRVLPDDYRKRHYIDIVIN